MALTSGSFIQRIRSVRFFRTGVVDACYGWDSDKALLQESQGDEYHHFLLDPAEPFLFERYHILLLLRTFGHELLVKFNDSCADQITEGQVIEEFRRYLVMLSQIAGQQMILFREVGMEEILFLLILEFAGGIDSWCQRSNAVEGNRGRARLQA